MTHFLQRSALIFLATSALCVTPAYARVHHAAHKAPAPKAANGKIVSLKGDAGAYVVKKGDTLEKIAGKLDTTIAELLKLNKLKKTSVLQPGDVIKGPAVARKAYVVASGDTVFSIARRFHVSVQELRDENDLSTRTQIRPGQKIRLPADYVAPAVLAGDDEDKAAEEASTPKAAKGRHAKPAPAEEADDNASGGGRAAAGKVVTVRGKHQTYRVRKGDTLSEIADKLNTDIAQLKADNHLKSTRLRPGQVLKGPSTTGHAYIARSGDTLALVAQRFGVSVERLRSQNGLSRRARIRSGQRLSLPDGYRDHGPVRGAEPSEPSEPERPSRATPPEPSAQLPSRPQPYQPSGSTPPVRSPPVITPNAAPAPTDAQISDMGKDRFVWPLRGAILSDFGVKPTGQRNDGINIQAETGAAVRSAADGDVVYAGDQVPGFGNLVLIKHADGWVTAYGHLSRVDVKMQQKVTQGQQIGEAGSSGGVPEPQLHFEVRYAPSPLERARPVDPKLVLPK